MLDKRHIYALDLETTYDGSPYNPEHSVVLGGVMCYEDGAFLSVPSTPTFTLLSSLDAKMLVGFNLGFDLPWCYRRDMGFQQWMGRNIRIWDCQLAEFILGGMREPYPKLENVAQRRLGRGKDTTVSDLWAAGVRTEDIDPIVLETYLRRDLEVTLGVFESQMAEAIEKGMLILIMQQMECLQATIDMTYNGMTIHKPSLSLLEVEFSERATKAQVTLGRIADVMGFVGSFNPSSPQQVALMLHGGTQEVERLVLTGVFKSGARKGEPKYSKITEEVPFRGFEYPIVKLTDKGKPATDEATLRELLAEAGGEGKTFLEALLENREVQKQLNTYIIGLPTYESADGLIHHEINHCVARTGRLTSSNPNLQNITNGPVKGAFIPPPGYQWLVEHDFEQLEMVALAVISGDEQLIADIGSGIDMHTHFYVRIYGEKPTKEQRTKFKRLMFGLVYGAGARKLAITSGLPLSICEAFIAEFYARYRGVAVYHEWILDNAKAMGYYSIARDDDGTPIKEYMHKSMTGRVYHFREYIKPFGRKEYGFSPTELKNRPIQGWATADVVPLAIGLLYRWVYRYNWSVRLINTVHDSVLSAVMGSESYAMRYANLAAQVLESVKERFEHSYDVKLPLALKVGASIGPTWLDQKELDRSGFLETEREDKDYTWLLHPES